MLAFEETVPMGSEDRSVHDFDLILLCEVNERLGLVTREVVTGDGSRERVVVENGAECLG